MSKLTFREEGLVHQSEVEVRTRRATPRGPMLDPPKNIRVSYRPPRKDPLRGPQLSPSTNSRVRSHLYHPERRRSNTPCPLQTAGEDKSWITMMTMITMI